MTDINHLINTAAELASEDGSNPEYDRALVELVGQFIPGEREDRMTYLYPLITGREYVITGREYVITGVGTFSDGSVIL